MDLLSSRVAQWEHFVGSIMDVTALQEAASGCDTVVHLAGLLGVENTELFRLKCMNINVRGTVAVLDACLQNGVKRILFSSSSEVYGDQPQKKIVETQPVYPKSVYAVSKLAAEEFIKSYADLFDMKYTIFRLFNVYGVNQIGQFVIPRFARAVTENQAPTLFADGKQIRAFCYVDDIADGIIEGLFSENVHNETINLGNDREPIEMGKLAETIISLAGKTNLRPRVASTNEQDRDLKRDVQWRVPSIEKAEKLLRFDPKISLKEGLKRVLGQEKIVESWSALRQKEF